MLSFREFIDIHIECHSLICIWVLGGSRANSKRIWYLSTDKMRTVGNPSLRKHIGFKSKLHRIPSISDVWSYIRICICILYIHATFENFALIGKRRNCCTEKRIYKGMWVYMWGPFQHTYTVSRLWFASTHNIFV